MDVKFTRIFKIDRENNLAVEETFTNEENVNNYIMGLLEKLANEEGQRLYKFDDSSTTVKQKIEELYNVNFENLQQPENENITRICNFLSLRLLGKEIEAQERYGHLGREIQKGMLILTFIEMTSTNYKIIISKSDYDKFIEEVTGELKEGLPQKKKIYKSFVVNIDKEIDSLVINRILTYDSNRIVSAYWWKEFLELEPLTSDEDNTINAFSDIDRGLLIPIKRKSKRDYLQLWNMTLAYFRSSGNFDFNFFKDEMIWNYEPIDPNLTKDFIAEKMNGISERKKFDSIFIKVEGVLNKRMKNTIVLTPEIDMIIKHDLPNIDTTIQGIIVDNEKYIMIKSDEGYKYATNRINTDE